VTLVLDASMALAWLLKRKDLDEADLAGKCLDSVRASGAMVPHLVSGGGKLSLAAERQRVIRIDESADFLSSMSIWR